MLGSIDMGQAYAHVVATNNSTFNISPRVFSKDAPVETRGCAIGRGGTSQVNAELTSGCRWTINRFGGGAVPLSGARRAESI